MEATGLDRYFGQIFSATSDFREVKKTPRFYQRVCEILKVRPEELVHVGDHYEFDYLVPRALRDPGLLSGSVRPAGGRLCPLGFERSRRKTLSDHDPTAGSIDLRHGSSQKED